MYLKTASTLTHLGQVITLVGVHAITVKETCLEINE